MQNYQTKIQNKDKEMFENQALNASLEWVYTFNIHFGSSVLIACILHLTIIHSCLFVQ